jgi:MATE family multidrug resistance protein
LFLRKRARKRYYTLSCRVDRKLLKRMLVYGLPNGAQLALDLVAFNIFSILLGCYGVTVHEASSITFGINNIAFCPIMGIGQTAAILVGQSIGANDIPLAKKSVRNAHFLVLIYSVAMMVLFSGFQDFMLSPFVRPGDAGQIETMRIAKIMLHFLSAYLLFDGTNITYSNVLRGAGDTSFTMWTLAVVGIVFFAIPCLAAFYFKMAWWVLWSLLCWEILLLCIIYSWRYLQGKWTQMRVIENN